MTFEGLFTAIVTPFDKNMRINESALRDFVDFQIENGVDGLVPVGTTGESATLTPEEHKKVVEIVIDQVDGRVKVLAGTGSNSTDEALDYTKHAKDAGADAALMISPYYNKPTQEGLYQHFKFIAEKVDIPIILYTVPGRTAVNINPETTQRLSKIKNIVGIKDASGSLEQVTKEIELCGKNFVVLSGEDALNYPIMCLGGKGAISVISNVAPKLTSELIHAALDGKFERARELHYKLFALSKVMFIETSPGPVKEALNMMGFKAGKPRLPLVPVSRENAGKIRAVLKDLKLV